jgi:hypothetical protein
MEGGEGRWEDFLLIFVNTGLYFKYRCNSGGGTKSIENKDQ